MYGRKTLLEQAEQEERLAEQAEQQAVAFRKLANLHREVAAVLHSLLEQLPIEGMPLARTSSVRRGTSRRGKSSQDLRRRTSDLPALEVCPPRGKRVSLTPEERAQASKLHDQGYGLREIARHFGVAASTVSRALGQKGQSTDGRRRPRGRQAPETGG